MARPLRAKVNPATIVAQHPAFARKEALVAAQTALGQSSGKPAVDPAYPWGVKWCGHPCMWDKEWSYSMCFDNFLGGFKKWQTFSVGGGGEIAMAAAMATSALTSKLPGKGGH